MAVLLTIFLFSVLSGVEKNAPDNDALLARNTELRKSRRAYVEFIPKKLTVTDQGNLERVKGEFHSIEMVYIPAGRFKMGSPDSEQGRHATESPQHDVEVSGFWMSEQEIKWELVHEWMYLSRDPQWDQEQYAPKQRAALARLPRPGLPYIEPIFKLKASEAPASGLTQYAAQEFCRWLSVRTGLLYRLPTEAEWEYAARAGTETAWHFGDDPQKLKEFAWLGESLEVGFHPPGMKAANPWGLKDMYGNVAEWTLDGWTDDYSSQAKAGKANPWVPRPAGSGAGVVRGGDWTATAQETRSAARRKQNDSRSKNTSAGGWQWFDLASDEGRTVGFRVVSPERPEGDGRESYLKILEK